VIFPWLVGQQCWPPNQALHLTEAAIPVIQGLMLLLAARAGDLGR